MSPWLWLWPPSRPARVLRGLRGRQGDKLYELSRYDFTVLSGGLGGDKAPTLSSKIWSMLLFKSPVKSHSGKLAGDPSSGRLPR